MTPEFTEKETYPLDSTFGVPVMKRTLTALKQLRAVKECSARMFYNGVYPDLIFDHLQNITVSSGDFVYLFPLGRRAYTNYQERNYKGYLACFSPVVVATEEKPSNMSIEITIVPTEP